MAQTKAVWSAAAQLLFDTTIEDGIGAPAVAVTLTDGEGAIVYAAGSQGNEAAGGRPRGAAVHEVTIDGKPYSLATSLDTDDQHHREDHLFRCAYFDDITGLPNRRMIEQTVERLIASDDGETFAMAFIDIDNFKHINDYYGHAVGDGLLHRIAKRLAGDIQPVDVLARVGGDEFVLLLRSAVTAEKVDAEVGRLLGRLKQPFFIDGYEIFSSASIGISLHPEHGRDYQTLRVNADSAMYRVKSATKGGFRFFDPEVGHVAAERMKVEQGLRLAIRDHRLCCAFQPKVDFRSDTVVGLEVLLRWRDERGVIHAPGEIIKLAVDLGLMDEITLMVLAQTTEKIDWINEAFGRETSISINVAAKQAGDVEFMTAFARELAATGYAERFMVELTEEAYLAKGQFQKRILPMLRDLGTGVSIDDFGVGYSSLSALADITADEIKVDRSFITDIHKRPRNQAILKVIETLGQTLGMSVIVEGVETFEELAYLQAATRINYAQGFYFAKPLVLDDWTGSRSEAAIRRAAQAPRATAVPRARVANRR